LLTHEDGRYAVRDYSDGTVKRYDSTRFEGMAFRDLVKSAEDNRLTDSHDTEDVTYWTEQIRSANRRIGRSGGLDLR
jgi:hypothetical protein